MKQALRDQMTESRLALTPETRDRETRLVHSALRPWLEGPIFLFYSVRDELFTRDLVEELAGRGEVAIPRITGKGTMVAARFERPLVRGPVGIPTSNGPELDVRVAVLPGLAFDRGGGRLGYGGGYYDRWLTHHPDVFTIGVGFGFQLVDEVPRDPHDRLLDVVICGGELHVIREGRAPA